MPSSCRYYLEGGRGRDKGGAKPRERERERGERDRKLLTCFVFKGELTAAPISSERQKDRQKKREKNR